jgi:hypothetical protein
MTWPRPITANELGRCDAKHGDGEHCLGAALASHGRSHRFDPCHAHQSFSLLRQHASPARLCGCVRLGPIGQHSGSNRRHDVQSGLTSAAMARRHRVRGGVRVAVRLLLVGSADAPGGERSWTWRPDASPPGRGGLWRQGRETCTRQRRSLGRGSPGGYRRPSARDERCQAAASPKPFPRAPRQSTHRWCTAVLSSDGWRLGRDADGQVLWQCTCGRLVSPEFSRLGSRCRVNSTVPSMRPCGRRADA